MDGTQPTLISTQELYRSLGTAVAPVVIDVRRSAVFAADNRMIVGAIRRDPGEIQHWHQDLPPERPVVVYCVHGREASQGAASSLKAAGFDARYLEHGISGWAERGLPMRSKRDAEPRSWVTRERPKIDRIACPWLIRRFIDPEAEFLFAPTERVFAVAAETGAIPYDIPGAEPFSHDGELCSFDAFLKVYGIEDLALDALALIVRGADTARLELTPQSPGLLATSLGLSAIYADDHAMLEQGMTIYDALYAWCRDCRDQGHDWNPAAMLAASSKA
jgi:rhodanese-related sulfurtransferase